MATSVESDQIQHSAVSDLCVHCLFRPNTSDTVIYLITISAQSSNLVVFRLQPVYFYLLLYKNICFWYAFELPRQVEAIQMSINICFYEENQKNIA